ncbi:MAG: glycosyltransferase family 2 protein [Muricauda sp. TMED12]|nr:MAG: glycosyltransferase family 2 protein [Muricauda sp. TMED12]
MDPTATRHRDPLAAPCGHTMTTIPVCDIVIVNWNSGEDLQACVDAIANLSQQHFLLGNTIVVDNSSSDGSADILVPDNLECNILPNTLNLGFAAACNQGARRCSGTHLLFINPDVIVTQGSVDALFRWLAAEPAYQNSICSIPLRDPTGRIACTCSRFPSIRTVIGKILGLEKLLSKSGWSQPMWEFDHQHTRTVDQVIGAFFLVPRVLYEQLGGFSHDYFLYYEEVDFCYRAKSIGSSSIFYAGTSSYHAGGGASRNIPTTRLKLNLQSRLVYYRKHFSRPDYWAALLLTLVIEPVTRVVFCLLSGNFRNAGFTLAAFTQLYYHKMFRLRLF